MPAMIVVCVLFANASSLAQVAVVEIGNVAFLHRDIKTFLRGYSHPGRSRGSACGKASIVILHGRAGEH